MNDLTTYGQTFSKGQLTIPKKIRDYYGLGENFAYKISHYDKKIIIEPQDQPTKQNLSAAIAKIKEPIFTDQDYKDYLKMRSENEQRLQEMEI